MRSSLDRRRAQRGFGLRRARHPDQVDCPLGHRLQQWSNLLWAHLEHDRLGLRTAPDPFIPTAAYDAWRASLDRFRTFVVED